MKDLQKMSLLFMRFCRMSILFLPGLKSRFYRTCNRKMLITFLLKNDEIAGFLAIQQLAGELEITNIAIKKAYQGHGLGSQLLANLDQMDYPIFLEVRASNAPAQALYKKFGFDIIGKRKQYYHEPVEDAIIMKREGK